MKTFVSNFSPLDKGEREGVRTGRGRDYAGFSLVESLVIISIISILASLSLVALPAARAHQQLISDTELVQSLLLDSKGRALNQVRPEECESGLSLEDPDRAPCSDVGIDFRIAGEVTQFADLNGNGEYEDTDYKIVTHSLSSSVTSDPIVFKSVPPSVETYTNGQVMTPNGENNIATITLTASNGEIRTLEMRQFGTLDIVE